MSFKQRVQDGFVAVAGALKATRVLLNGNAADLSALTTTAKGNIVAAINEVDAAVDALSAAAGASINDASNASLTETYSVTKIRQEDADNRAALKAEILGGAAAAQDTLAELKAYADSGAAADLLALANRLRIDVNTQGLTAPERQNGQDNLDVYSRAQMGEPETDFGAAFAAALV